MLGGLKIFGRTWGHLKVKRESLEGYLGPLCVTLGSIGRHSESTGDILVVIFGSLGVLGVSWGELVATW